MLVFNWSVGLAVLRSGALPKWLGWSAIVFGVISLAGPIGFFGALGAALWIIIASIMLSMRARRLQRRQRRRRRRHPPPRAQGAARGATARGPSH